MCFTLVIVTSDTCSEVTVPMCNTARHNMENLPKYLAVTDFYNGITKMNVTFDVLGNGVPRYDIFNFRRNKSSKLEYTKVRGFILRLSGKMGIELQAFSKSNYDGCH